jgi:hypothetical protein
MQAILLCCQLLLDPGDNIVIVSPIWPNITSAAKLVRGEPKYVALDRKPDGSWKLDLQKVFDAVDERTRAIFVNSPGNPDRLDDDVRRAAALLDFARKRGVWIMADEVYARLIYTRPVAPSFLELAGPDDPLLVLNSLLQAVGDDRLATGLADPSGGAGRAVRQAGADQHLGRAAFPAEGRDRRAREGRRLRAEMVERCRAGGEQVFQRLSAQPRHQDRPAGSGLLQLLLDRWRHRHHGLLQEAGKGIQGRPGAGRGVRPGWAGQRRLCFASGAERLSKASTASKRRSRRYDANGRDAFHRGRHLRKVYGEIVASTT